MGKKSKQASKPNPITLLRPRLETLMTDEARLNDESAAFAALDEAAAGMKIYDVIPVLLRVYGNADAGARRQLDTLVPQWLKLKEHDKAVLTMLERDQIFLEGRADARRWLEGADADALAVIQAESFRVAYQEQNQFQGMILVSWYSDSRKLRVSGMNFLLDYVAPWHGAVKDIAALRNLDAQTFDERYIEGLRQRDMTLEAITASAAKEAILEALEANRSHDIRLPPDLVRARTTFAERILTLPGEGDFTMRDFDTLSKTGRSTEELRRIERNTPYIIPGREGGMGDIVVLGDPFGDDDY